MTSGVLSGEEAPRERGERVGTIARKRIKRKVMRQRGSGVVDKTDYPKTPSGGVGRWRRRGAVRCAGVGEPERRRMKQPEIRDAV